MVAEMELFESPDLSLFFVFVLFVCLFVEFDEERSLQKKGGYTVRIACSHFGCCCPHKETLATRCLRTRVYVQ